MLDSASAYTAVVNHLGLDQSYEVAPPGRPPVWVDGLDIEQAAIIEIVPVGDPSTWLLSPEAQVPTPLVTAAGIALDTRLLRLREVLADPSNPMDRLLLFTDQPCAVDVLADAVSRTALADRTVVQVVRVDG